MKFGIGQPAARVEDRRFLTGQGRYVDDIVLRGMLHAAVLRAPVAHGTIRAIDAAAARAMPGVHLVLTAADVAGRLAPITCRIALTQSDGRPFAPIALPRLADGVVRYVGQPVALVVADTPHAARDGVEAIGLEIDEMPCVVVAEDALAPGAAQVWADVPGNLAYDWAVGDGAATDAAFAAAAHRVRVRVVNQRLIVATMEPRGVLVRHDPASGWEMWIGSQGAHSARDQLAAALMVDKGRVRAHSPDVGGAFGMKLMDHPEYALAALAAAETGRPVKWVGDRSESFLSDIQARDLTTDAEGAFDAAGRIVALRFSSLSGLGAGYSTAGPGVHTVFSAPLVGGMYHTPVFHHRVRGVLTHTTPTDAYRGAGRPEVIHATEQVMEAAAHAMGLDPVHLRRLNLVRPDQLPYRTHGGFLFDSLAPETNLDRTLSAIDYAGFAAREAASARAGKLRGIAVSYYFERTGGSPQENGTLRVQGDGVEAAVGTQSTGQGHETAWAQIIHEALGIPFASIRVLPGDSAALPMGGGTGGSRSTIMAGRVLLRAAEDVIAKGLARAAEHLEAATADIAFSATDGGRYRILGTDRSVGLLELAGSAPIDGWGEVKDTTATFPNGCHAAEVEIDSETGAVRILAHVVTDDFGRLINPALVAGQVHGGIVQGAGQILGEAARYDPRTGQPLAASFMDYPMPRAGDFPSFDIAFTEVPCTTNPLGVKGCGEAGTVGAIPALALAITNALRKSGVTQLTPPFTPHNIWSALRRAADASV